MMTDHQVEKPGTTNTDETPAHDKNRKSPSSPRAAGADQRPAAKPQPDGERRQVAKRSPAAGKPRIGDTRPAPEPVAAAAAKSKPAETSGTGSAGSGGPKRRRRRRGGRGRATGSGSAAATQTRSGQRRGGSDRQAEAQSGPGDSASSGDDPVQAVLDDDPVKLDAKTMRQRRGRTRKGRTVGRYVMCVHVGDRATQIAILEGRQLIEHHVSRPSDDISQIHGNIYLGRVQNVLPGMEAAFVDIGTPKNAVLYRGDVQYDTEDIEAGPTERPRIEELLKTGQSILCQVTKNPIAHKGARLTQEVSLPGRFVVLVPESSTCGISKRLPDGERKRLRSIMNRVRPAQHGLIVRTAAEKITSAEIERDVARLVQQWNDIVALSKRSRTPSLLYREPETAVRVIREEFTKDYRAVIIDDQSLFGEMKGYVHSIDPALAERVELHDLSREKLPLFERHHIEEQLRKALDRKVWLPSGGSLVIEHTEALTVIDVNTSKNVGRSSLEQTVFENNLEAAEEVARQLRLRDIGGIIVIDFVDMEASSNRSQVMKTFRNALARDKTRTQVIDISDLGLVEMTRKRIGEGLLESLSDLCADCDGRGVVLLDELLSN